MYTFCLRYDDTMTSGCFYKGRNEKVLLSVKKVRVRFEQIQRTMFNPHLIITSKFNDYWRVGQLSDYYCHISYKANMF